MVLHPDHPRNRNGSNHNLPPVLPLPSIQNHPTITSPRPYVQPPKPPLTIHTNTPKVPRKIYTFHSDPLYTAEEMFLNESLTLHTLHNWIPLSSESRGYVAHIDPNGPYDLPEPDEIAVDRHNDGPGYMMSVFHQLHCLSYLAENFQRGYGGKEMTKEVSKHSAHCFNYIRQGITCNADVTLEGKTEAGPGEGSEHECVDYDALLEWANEHAAYRWRNGLLPDDAIL
jgi:hypothetical protein